MEQALVSNQAETRYGFSKIAKATDLLNLAASIFDQAGMQQEANDITKIIEGLGTNL
jgi:hypothetical protein